MQLDERKIAISYHLHFPDLIPEMIWYLGRFSSKIKKIITVTPSILAEDIAVIELNIDNVEVIQVSNNGRDLKAFLSLIKGEQFDNYEWILKAHGKKSQHRADGAFMRRQWSEDLAPENEPLKLISEVPSTASNVRLIAPETCLINPAGKHNWVSNITWLNKVLSRIVDPDIFALKYDAWEYPILAGSFYWISNEGIKFLKQIPVTEDDWIESARDGIGIDGKLEHAIERLMLFDLDFKGQAKNQKVLLFKNSDGTLRSNLFESLKLDRVIQAEIQPFNDLGELIELNNPSKNDFIAHWSVKHSPNRTHLECIFFSGREKSGLYHLLEVRVNDRLYETFSVSSICQPLYLPGVSNGLFAASVELYGEIPAEKIKVVLPGRALPLKNLKKSTCVKVIKRAAYITYQTLAPYLSLETANLAPTPRTRISRESKYLNKITCSAADAGWELRSKLQEVTMNIFIVNNSFTGIVASRTINSLKLAPENLLIIYHRQTPLDLLSAFDFIETKFPDFETSVVHKAELQTTDCLLKVLETIAGRKFALFSYHYYSLFASILAWSPLCVQCNLLEEGNLNNRPAHEFQRVANLQGHEFFPEKIGTSDHQVLNFYLYQASKFLRTNLFSKSIPKHSDFVCGSDLKIKDVTILNNMRRDYFFHPKMALGTAYFRITPPEILFDAEPDPTMVLLGATSSEEQSLLSYYEKEFFNNSTAGRVIIALPSILGINENVSEYLKTIMPKLEQYSPFILTYLRHPGETNKLDWENILREAFVGEYESLLVDVQSSPEGVVSDLFCTRFSLMIHFGSSLVRSVSSISPEIEFINLR